MAESFLPRREVAGLEPTAPSGGGVNPSIANFLSPINVRPQQFVDMPSPYVATQQTANFINSLGQFNDSLGKFGTAYHKYDVEQNTLQGQADAMGADPEQVRQIFRQGLDEATKNGLFPQNAHPVYRMEFMKTAAQAQVLRDLPTEIDKQGDELVGDFNKSISGTLNATSQDWINQNFQDPLSRMYANQQAQSVLQQKQSQFEARREAYFRQAKEQNSDQSVAGSVNGLVTDYQQGKEDAIPTWLGQIQSKYDDMRKQGIANPAVRLKEQIIPNLMDQVRSGQLSTQDAQHLLDTMALNIKAGTGKWGDIAEVKEGLASFTHTMSTMETQSATHTKTLINNRDELAAGTVEDAVGQLVRSGKPITNETKETLAQSVLQANPSMNILRARRLVDEAAQKQLHAEATKNSDPAALDNLTRMAEENPEQAAIQSGRYATAGVITRDDQKKIMDAARKQMDLSGILKENNFKIDDIEKPIDDIVSHEGALTARLTAKDTDTIFRVQSVKDEAQQSYYANAVSKVRAIYDSDPKGELRLNNPTEFNRRVATAIQEAKSESIKQAGEWINKFTNDPVIKDPTLGQWAGQVAVGRRIVQDSLQKVDPKTKKVISNPEGLSIPDRTYLSDIPKRLTTIAGVYKYGNDTEKQTALNAYSNLLKLGGYNPDEVIAGKTADGFPIDASKLDAGHDQFFRNWQQYDSYWKEVTDNAAKGIEGQSRIEQLFNTLGLKDEQSQKDFLRLQRELLKRRALPSSVEEYIKKASQ